MRHVRKCAKVGETYTSRKTGPVGTLCGAPITIHDVSFRALQTAAGAERLGPDLCPECVRLRLEVSHRPQVNQRKLRRELKRAEGLRWENP